MYKGGRFDVRISKLRDRTHDRNGSSEDSRSPREPEKNKKEYGGSLEVVIAVIRRGQGHWITEFFFTILTIFNDTLA